MRILPVLLGCLLGTVGIAHAVPPEVCEIDPVTAECVPIDPCDIDGPGEVTGVLMPDTTTLTWNETDCIQDFNVYRGTVADLDAGLPPRCHGDEIQPSTFQTPQDPGVGETYVYLVTGERGVDEGTPGKDSAGVRRALLGRCDAVMRNHVLNRTGYGWNEWSRDRLATAGLQGYIAQQLDPQTISEAGNTELTSRLAAIEPPETLAELQGVDLIKAVYARRQLEQATTLFWVNHFNTEYRKSFQYFFFFQATDPVRRVREAVKLHYDEMEAMRATAFGGTFYDLAEISMLSPAMIIYLDTIANTALRPNENYARELLELHTMGVNGGYTDDDIVALAKVFSGWGVCRKDDLTNGPLDDCLDDFDPTGTVVADFESADHDCTAKTLFLGTPHQVNIADTCGDPDAGVNDAFDALAGIVDHPSTARFISTKLLQKYVTETPSTPMVDAVVAAWETAANEGDLDAVMQEVFALGFAAAPDMLRDKIKTPFEQMSSAFRATRGETDGLNTVGSYLTRMQHRLHENPVPTGYSELGSSWIDTNNTLERQNLGAAIATGTNPTFGSELILLLNANGVVTSQQGNADRIVGFLADTMFGGALTPAEKQAAVDFLTTDDFGVPSDYDDTRIREAAAFMLGFGQFQAQ